MILRTSALWAGLLMASVSFAQYTVKKGDTIETIAKKLGVSQKSLLAANRGKKPQSLQIGAKLSVPGGTGNSGKSSRATASKSSGKRSSSSGTKSGTYAVRNGENDWSIAKRHGMTVSELHRLNPNTNWSKLQIGAKLSIRSTGASVKSAPSSKTSARVASKPSTSAKSYKVQSGDNDWVLAKRFGTTVSNLHKLNPGVNWNRLREGASIRVPGSDPKSATPIRGKYAKISGENVIVRSKPGTSGKRLTTVDTGKLGSIVDRQSGWYKLRFPGGTTGWVRSDFVSAAPANTRKATVAKKTTPERQPYARSPRVTSKPKSAPSVIAGRSGGDIALLDTAFSLLGTRYRWGGTSRSGFDCSGFTSYVYRSHGVHLPRTSREMANSGYYVPKSELSKGDLVFFKTNRGTRINHVGIYIGGGKFIHASSGAGYVRTDTLNSGYYAKRYATGRRVSGKLHASTRQEQTPQYEEGVSPVDPAPEHDTTKSAPETAPPAKVTPGADEISR